MQIRAASCESYSTHCFNYHIYLFAFVFHSHFASRPYTAVCSLDCGPNGICESGKCRCNPGFVGNLCDQLPCDPRCAEHGQCKNGTCVCSQGWNGRHCTLCKYLSLTRTHIHTPLSLLFFSIFFFLWILFCKRSTEFVHKETGTKTRAQLQTIHKWNVMNFVFNVVECVKQHCRRWSESIQPIRSQNVFFLSFSPTPCNSPTPPAYKV